jgi:hypothetical protein
VVTNQTGIIAFALALLLLVGVPELNYLINFGSQSEMRISKQGNEVVVYGGRRLNGFLIVADGAPLREDVPTLHFSEFAAIIDESELETDYQGLIHPQRPNLPFAFVFAPRVKRNYSSAYLYIVPPEVLDRREVAFWRFKTQDWQLTHDPFWFYVSEARPIKCTPSACEIDVDTD